MATRGSPRPRPMPRCSARRLPTTRASARARSACACARCSTTGDIVAADGDAARALDIRRRRRLRRRRGSMRGSPRPMSPPPSGDAAAGRCTRRRSPTPMRCGFRWICARRPARIRRGSSARAISPAAGATAERVAGWAARDYESALVQLRVQRALGDENLWRSSLARALALAGERRFRPTAGRPSPQRPDVSVLQNGVLDAS